MTRAGQLDRECTVEYKAVSINSDTGVETVAWTPLVTTGSPPVAVRFACEKQDALPSRSESVTQGLALARNQTRLRLRYRTDITSDMRVTIHGGGDVVYQIVGGPAEIGGRQAFLELVLERYSS